ncbi:MAG: chromosome segregation protein SMC [Cyclobacteriaceae bacterium]|nr:chromosome segregation protein SMC [Cyclobacteriaceae bacterium]
MQLTRLEIKGFKSFADKVTINFDEGITGIVGPNGCGKSNVVDSIRWVLGEQKTRVLRSEKMENIIFNGTKNRKPTQLAEVSLTFNNTKNLIPTEFSQVTITRKYFRSGESEYQLNGVPCRLKDITNLFLDTGIASNSYAIIELKMVDDLLNDKDNSRRSLFEEAAGISKFKIRKKETLKKLSDTDADLARVEDLLFEIDKNLKSLEKQARQAKRYFEIKEEYKLSSIAMARKTIEYQQKTHDNIASQLAAETDRKLSLNTQLAEKDALLETTKAQLLTKEKLLSGRQKSLNEHVNKIRQYESEKKLKNERQRFLEDKINRLREQLSQDKQSNERAAFSLQGLEKEQAQAEKELAEVHLSLDTLKSGLEEQKQRTTEAQQQLNELNQQYLSRRETVFQLNKELEFKQIQLGSLRNELEKTSEDSSFHTNSLQEFGGKIAEIEQERKTKNETYEKFKADQERLLAAINVTQQKIEKVKDELSQTNRLADARQNEYNLTKSLVENLEGFPEAIKFLKKKPQWKNAPLLSDVIGCPDEYRICIENYLEPYMNYYVVSTLDEAIQAVQALNEASRGKVNFFILEQLKNWSTSPSSQNIEHTVKAMDIVEYESEYSHLISYLLDGVYVYSGKKPTPPGDNDAVLLEKTGQIAFRKYSVSGGSVGLFEGKRIGRAKNLEKLAGEIKSLKSNQQSLNDSLQSNLSELDKLKSGIKTAELERLREEINRLNETYATFKTRQEQFENLLSSSALRREDIQSQLIETHEAIQALIPRAEEEKEQIADMEHRVADYQSTMEELNEALTQRSTAYNEANVLFHQKENRVRSIVQEAGFKQESYATSLERIERNTEELQTTEQDLNELVRKTSQNDDDLIAMYNEKEAIELGVNEAEKEYYQTRGTIDEEEKAIREIQRMRERADLIVMEWTNKINELKISLASTKERLSVEFNIDYSAIDDEAIQNLLESSTEELRETVNRLKSRMDSMGPINPMAMEAYEEIKERYDFITAQKDDLLKAKDSLLSTIQEIDTVAKETFLDAFGKIKESFIRVFRTLFTDEDDCDVFLTDPSNPLESPIDIIAKPKGKRPLSINQLSGGEKTLTAISLLFAIYLLKPAPFCVFDEVDAPLDDANIDKFNQIIREFSKESQFIIVTHNKRTMASTDIIYGITMIEQGISRVVPVDLRELA